MAPFFTTGDHNFRDNPPLEELLVYVTIEGGGKNVTHTNRKCIFDSCNFDETKKGLSAAENLEIAKV